MTGDNIRRAPRRANEVEKLWVKLIIFPGTVVEQTWPNSAFAVCGELLF